MRILLVLLFSVQTFASVDEFSSYIDSASNHKLGMNLRWAALIKAAEHSSPDQLNQIQNFSSNKIWYMRNASLVALNKINPVAAVAEARKLIRDKALVVRSAAVEILAANLNEENKALLAEELNKPYNFNKKSSLWIRMQIVEKISQSAGIIDRHFFVKNLFDSDKNIARLSAKTLSKITGQQIDGSKQIEKWQLLAKQNNWL